MLPASPDPARARRRPAWPYAVAALVVVAILCAALLLGGPPDVAAFQRAVRDAGLWAPALFVLLQVVVTVTPVPRTVFTVAAGVLFGSVLGVAVAVLATVGAAAVAFWLVRLGTVRLVVRYADLRAMRWARARLDRSGMLAVMSLRLVPMVPFPAVNYASGASGVRFAPYLLGTAIGVLPGTVAVVVLGDAVTEGMPHPALIAVSVVCGLIGLAGVLVAARPPQPTAG